MGEPCRHLEWDSGFFRLRIAALAAAAPTPSEMDAAEKWCAEEKIDCLSFLAGGDDFNSIRLAEDRGFHLVDIRMRLEKTLTRGESDARGDSAAGFVIREFQENDLDALKRSARENHTQTRFFTDTRFPRDKAAELYAVWIEKSCRDPQQTVFVALSDGKPAGYISCRADTNRTCQIVLAGVDNEYRGRGIGTLLLKKAGRWCADQRANSCEVVTQGTNISAQRLYTSNGFYPTRVQLWYHKWFSPRGTLRQS